MDFVKDFIKIILWVICLAWIIGGSALIKKRHSNNKKKDDDGKLYYADSNVRAFKINENGDTTPVYRIRRTKTGCLQCSKCYKFLSKSKIIDHCPHCGCEFDWVDIENFFM